MKSSLLPVPSQITLSSYAGNASAAGLVIVEISPPPSATNALSSRIVFANQAFATMLEDDVSTLIGRNLLDVITEEYNAELAGALYLGSAQLLNISFVRRSGTPIYAHIHCTPIHLEEQEHTATSQYVLCTFVDVTDYVQTNESLSNELVELEHNMHRRTRELQELIDEIQHELRQRRLLEQELKRAERRYRSLAENFPNGAVIMLNKHGECLLVEGTQSERIPLRREQNRTFLDEPLATAAHTSIVQAFEGKHVSCEIMLAGEPYMLHAVPLSIEREFIEAVMLVCQNITDFKTRQQLEKEQEMTELKYRFVTIASHELRTPLAGMMLAAGILRRYWKTSSNEEKWETLQDIMASLDRMSNLLENILIVGKSDSGKLPFEPQQLDLIEFCSSLVREYEKSLGQTHITHTDYSTKQLAFWGDPKLLRLILGNLLSNAYKYSPDGTHVYFSLRHTADSITMTVRDSGIGIPPEDIPHLFVSFHRGKNVGEIQGTGLGLAIVDRAVKMHGGAIVVDSTLNVGTTFEVTLPLVSPS
ncbi:MAG: ATP-binding protein [Bacteroidota bacterium]|nr:PAS domain-containing sensor histidine kinase [Candidatus Kapabacteria bacterium]MDW8220296.1 ATP-binding protein [Bacteroidota bacterium]